MRDQYVGDVSDVIKFSFLRALANSDRRLRIAWYYLPGHDGRPDGRHREWQGEPAWKNLDPVVHEALSQLPQKTNVATLEKAPIWPEGTLFHGVPVARKRGRDDWSAGKRSQLEAADLIFLDPDNGLGTTSKHVTLGEIQNLRKPGRAIVFISFPGMNGSHDAQREHLHQRLLEVGARQVLTLWTCVSVPRSNGSSQLVPRFRRFTIVDPDATLAQRAAAFQQALSSIPRVKAKLERTVAGS